jgi:hypothetical protein
MKKQTITVKFIYEDVSYPKDNLKGVLLSENRAFVADYEGMGIYAVEPTDDPNTYIANLDKDDTDYLKYDPNQLIDLIAR